jgi:hypothetical protein
MPETRARKAGNSARTFGDRPDLSSKKIGALVTSAYRPSRGGERALRFQSLAVVNGFNRVGMPSNVAQSRPQTYPAQSVGSHSQKLIDFLRGDVLSFDSRIAIHREIFVDIDDCNDCRFCFR